MKCFNGVCLVFLWTLPATSMALSLPVSGSLQYLLSHSGAEGTEPSTVQSTSLELGTALPIWRQWLGRVEGKGLFSKTFSDGPQGSGSDQVVTGRGDISIFPQSPFPFEAFVERLDSRVNGASGPDSERQVTRFGILQRYESDLLGRYSLSYSRRRTEQSFEGESLLFGNVATQEELDFEASKRFKSNDVDYNFRYQDSEQATGSSNITEQSHVLSHVLDAATTYTISNLASYSRLTSDGSLGTDESRQISSTVLWRPQLERSMRVTANGLWRDRQVSGAGTVDNALASGSVRGFYQWTDALDLDFGVSASQEDSGGRERTFTTQSLGAGYAPDSIELGGFSYGWNAGLAGSATQSSVARNTEQTTASLGHSLSRRWMVAGTPVQARVSQRGSASFETNNESGRTITHSGNLSWSLARSGSQLFASLDVADSRRYDETESVSQLANAQLTSNVRLSRYRTLNGGVTVQASRSRAGASEEFFESYSSSVDLSYRDARLLGLRNFAYLSQLRWRTSDIALLLESEDQDQINDKSWRNRWTYGIGLVDLSLDSLVSADRDNEPAYSLVLQVRRRFSLY